MGKPSQQHRNRIRMMLFNIYKSAQDVLAKNNQIENLKLEVFNLNQEVHQLKEKTVKLSFEKEEALREVFNLKQENSNLYIEKEVTIQPQKDVLSKKHCERPTEFQQKPDLFETKQANLESDRNMDGPLTVDIFIKYMDELHNELMTSIGESVRTEVSLVDIT